MLLKTKF